MSALDRFLQSEINSSYCERRVVIGRVDADVVLIFGCLRNCSFVCRLTFIASSRSLEFSVIASKYRAWP
jgi:hypothetical protein